MEKKSVITIGGGIAGVELSGVLADLGYQVSIIEKEPEIGGKINLYDHLFPDMKPASEMQKYIREKVSDKNITVLPNTEIESIQHRNGKITLRSVAKETYTADAVAVASGFNFFNARRKEEYGYKIYNNVLTSVDLEQKLKSGKLTTANGKIPQRVAFIHCVGSRDEKSGNHYCSKVCCITGVKQAIEVNQLLPEAEIYCFYMDLRMTGLDHEMLYRKAQEQHNVQFVRGRLSEASENIDETLLIKAEDTLSGRPIKMNVDLLVLLVGMEAGEGTRQAGEALGLDFESNGFLKIKNEHTERNRSSQKGIFVAGTCTRPMSIDETIEHARSAALDIHQFLKTKD
jgi:heterodisulfide reductase subunit A